MAESTSIKELMLEVDVNVRRFIDTFRFLLKYRILFRGSGIEFAGLREYVPMQDDATKIDWKASLRSNTLQVKQYEEERDLDVYVLLDSSSSMLFGTQQKLKSEYAAVVAGTLVYAGIEAGDNVGFGMFNDSLLLSLSPSGDISRYYTVLKSMANPKYYGGTCNLGDILLRLLETVEDKTILFILSDFIGLDEGWDNALKMISSKLDRVFGVMIRDERDSFIPKDIGVMCLRDPFSDDALMVNLDNVRQQYQRTAEIQEKNIQDTFHDSKAGFVKVYTHKPFVEAMTKHLSISIL